MKPTSVTPALAWMTDIETSMNAGDAALEDITPERVSDLPATDRIALATAHYLRAAAAAQAEIALHAESVPDQLSEVRSEVGHLYFELASVASSLRFMSSEPPRRTWQFWRR